MTTAEVKADFVLRVAILLSLMGRGDDQETEDFQGKKHDALCALLVGFLERHKSLLGVQDVEIIQGWNDRGTDVILKRGDLMIGFQIKSPGDVLADDFVGKVKQQLTDSLGLDLIKWYLLVCSPAVEKRKRVNHILSDIAALRTRYPAAVSPNSCCRLFKPDARVEESEFVRALQAHRIERDDADAMRTGLRELLGFIGSSSEAGPTRELPQISFDEGMPPQSGARLSDVLGWGLESAELQAVLRDLNELFETLRKLSPGSRQFYSRLLQMAAGHGETYVRPREVEYRLHLAPTQVQTENSMLEDALLTTLENADEGPIISLHAIGDLDPAEVLDDFAKKVGVPLDRLIVDLRFDLLDAEEGESGV